MNGARPITTFVDCHGDYRNELHLEDPNLPLYAHQASLPRLPIPSLEETVENFLPSALPLAKSPEETESLLAATKSFPQEAAHLQERLMQRSQEYDNSSWLQHWWSERIYLQCRDPLFYISFFYRLQYDDSCQRDGLMRAAAALQSVAVLSQEVCSGQKQPDTVGRSNQPIPLCSTQFKYLLKSCRIPRPGQDSYRMYTDTVRLHVAVACRGQFYKLHLTDQEGRIYSRSALHKALQRCQELAIQRQTLVPELGWLTATHRDTWSETYQLLTSDPGMAGALHDLQSALCVLCLDEGQDLTEAEHAAHIWHGNLVNSANRWMDKSMQITVNADGGLGYVGEHSMQDGMPAMLVSNYMMNEGRVGSGEPAGISPDSGVVEEPVGIFDTAFRSLDSELKVQIDSRIQAARQEVTHLVRSYDVDVLSYTRYGSSEIKTTGCSPDAFVQIAMQLAGYRLFGEQVGTYEATQMRAFLHGRTETTRGVSVASQAFVVAMRRHHTIEEKRYLLQQACSVHTETTRKASTGRGIDRHLFGLTSVLRDGEPNPSLFDNETYKASKRWRLSTSTVPNMQCGFCCVDDDGLGIGYDVRSGSCVFNIVGRKDREYVGRMASLLTAALDEMIDLARTQPAPVSKL